MIKLLWPLNPDSVSSMPISTTQFLMTSGETILHCHTRYEYRIAGRLKSVFTNGKKRWPHSIWRIWFSSFYPRCLCRGSVWVNIEMGFCFQLNQKTFQMEAKISRFWCKMSRKCCRVSKERCPWAYSGAGSKLVQDVKMPVYNCV